MPVTRFSLTESGSVQDDAGNSYNFSISQLATIPATTSASISPSQLTYADQIVGHTSSAQGVALHNTGTNPISFTSIAITGTNAADFAVSANTCGASLAVAASCQISVTFQPSATGARAAQLTFSDTLSGSPQNITLSGTGQAAPTYTLSFAPTSLTYSSQVVGTSSTQRTIVVQNTGTGTVTFTGSGAITGTNASDFAITSNTCGASLTSGSSCQVGVTFTPGAAGTRSAGLAFVDNAAGSPQNVPLSGTGQALTRTLSFTPPSLVFATQSLNSTSAPQAVTVQNTGNSTVTFSVAGAIAAANAGDFAISSNTCGGTLAAGASCAVNVKFSPAATGARGATLAFTDDANGSPQNVSLSGTGQNAPTYTLSISPGSLTYAAQNTGTTSNAQSVTVQNTGNQTVTFSSSPSIAGANAADFSISGSTCGSTLTAGASCAVSVKFSPGAAGSRTASLGFVDNATGSPQSVGLSGTGQTPTYTLSFTPSSLAFATQNTGTTSLPQSVSIQNTGNSGVNFTSIAITGTNAGDFSINGNTCPATLIPSSSCSVSVTLSPTANGSRAAALTVTDNATGSPQSVSLSGTGQTITKTLTFTPTGLTFAAQNTGSTSAGQSFTVKNTGNATVTFTSIGLTGTNAGDFSLSGNNCASQLAANNTCSVTVTFSPTATGARNAAVTFTDDATGNPQSVSLSGTGQTPTHTLTFSPTSLTFAAQNTGTTSVAQGVTIQNTGNAGVSFTSIALTGTNAGDFSISGNTCPATLAASSSCSVSITFSPTANGSRAAALTVTDNATGSPQAVTLTGTGQTITKTLTFTPTGLTFAAQNTGSTSAGQSFTVKNTGNASVTFTSIALTGANAGDFSISGNSCASQLTANNTCSVTVTFSPTATGVRGAAVTFTDDAAGSPQSVNLTGTGQLPTHTLSFNPTSLTFAPQNTGTTSAAQSVSIQNIGNAGVNFTSIAITGTNAGDFSISANSCPGTLAASSSCSVSITFSPTANGSRVATLTVTDNATGSPQSISLSGTGQTVTHTLSFNPTSLTFAAQNTGTTSAAQGVSIQNVGTGAVTMNGVSITGANASDFAIQSSSCPTGGSTLAAGTSCSVQITFSPGAAGARAASLQVADNATGNPQSISLSGTGQTPTHTLSFSPSSLTYPTVNTNSSSPLTLNVTNAGNSPVTFTSFEIFGTNASDFSITQNTCPSTPASLAASGGCSITVTFSPSAAGSRSASLTLTDNATGNPQNVALTGVGQVQTISLNINPSSLTFAARNLSSTSPAQNVTLTNNGNTAVTFSGFSLTGANAADFAISGNTCPSGANTLAVNASCAISVTFTPSALGSRAASLSIADNATGSPQAVTLTGTGQNTTRVLTFNQVSLTFPTVTFGNNSVLGLSIQSTGTDPVTFSSFAISGANASEFSITNNNCPASPATLAPPASCSLNVTFTPSAAGTRTASLVVTDNATGSPQSIGLSGVGQAPASTITLSPLSYTFPTPLNIGSTSSQVNLAITNTGTGTVSFTSFTLGGANAGDFAIVQNTCPQPASVLAINATCYVGFEFIPTAAGSRTATLTIVDNATGTPHHFTIAGTGQTPTSTLTFSPSSIIFSTAVTVGSTSAQTYTLLTNAGNTPITFNSIAISGANAADFKFTASTGCSLIFPATLAAGGGCYLYVNFTPSAPGVETATVVLTDSASGSPQSITISGTGQPATQTLSFNPGTITYGNIALGSSSQNYTYITNGGTAPVTLNAFSISGTNAGDFAFSNSSNCPTPPTTLAANATCYVYVTFSPQAIGPRTANFVITDTASGSPHSVGLSGTGSSTATFTVAPATLAFGPQNKGVASAARNVTLFNSGGSAVSISNVQITGANAADFGFLNHCGSSVASNSNCIIAVTFTPSTTAAESASLTITDTGANSPQSVSLTGTGQSATQTLDFLQNTLTFAIQNLNSTSAAQNVEVYNNGSGSVTIAGATIGGVNAGDFAISGNTCTALTAGSACYISIVFSPLAVGARAATLQVSDTATGSPQSITLLGTGRAATQTLSFSATVLAYSSQVLGTTSAGQYFYITNTGNSTVTLNSALVTGTNAADFAITSQSSCYNGLVFTPSSSCYYYVAFTPAAVGNRTALFQVNSSASGSPQTVTLIGVGQSSSSIISLSSNGINFGQQNEFTTSGAQYFYIYNNGTQPLSLNSLAITGANASDFSIYDDQCPISPAAVAAGSNCYMYLQFTPTTTGQESATLQINDSAGGSPHYVQLSGIGIGQTQITSLQPNSIAFGAVLLGSSSPVNSQYFYVYNRGTVPLTFTSFNIVGANSGDFSIQTNTCPSGSATLATNAGCYLYMTFTPQAVGPRTASLVVADSAADGGGAVTLGGIGEAPSTLLTLNPNSISFGAQILNTSSGATSNYFYIYNRGTDAVTISNVSITGTNASDFALGTTTCGSTLSVGGGCYYYVTFTPTGAGPRSASVQITDSATGSPHKVALNGIGQSPTPLLRFYPQTSAVFAAEAVGTTSGQQSIQLYNDGNAPITMNSITLSGGNASDFAITSNSCPSGGASLAANAACNVYITFRPSASGQRTTNLQVTDSLSNSPQTLPLIGLGSGASSILEASVSNLVYGAQNISTTSGAQSVSIYNEGNTAITGLSFSLTGANAGDYSIFSTNCATTLNAGSGCTVNITFTPSAVDVRSANLQITGAASNSPQLLGLSGIGQVATQNSLYLSQTQLTYGLQNVNTTSGVQAITIYNQGTANITISGISITGTNSGDFGIYANNCSSVLAAGGGCTVDVTFTPATIGARTATLQVVSNAAGSPQTAGLFGTGQAVTEQTYLSVTALAFLPQTVNTTSTQAAVSIYNQGTGVMTFSASTPFRITGTNSGDFALTGSSNCGTTLAAGVGCTEFVSFRPSAAGYRTATLAIASDAPGSPQTVELSGTGLLQTTTDYLGYSALAFGNQIVGTPSTQRSDTLYNYGTTALTVGPVTNTQITGANASDFSVVSTTCSNASVASGSSCSFYVVFTPSGSGFESATLALTDSSDNPVSVLLTGTGVAQTQLVDLNATTLTFAPQVIGTVSAQSGVSLYNYGNTTTNLTNFAISGSNAGDFAISLNNCASTLTTQAGCTVYVRFTPSLAGSESATLKITDSASNSPQSVSLFGTGLTAVSQLTLSDTSLNFGAQTVATSSTQKSVSFYNYGNTAINLTGFAVGGTNATEFSIVSNNCGSVLNVNGGCSVSLKFTPAATGQRLAFLQITDTANGSPQAVNLYGTGQ